MAILDVTRNETDKSVISHGNKSTGISSAMLKRRSTLSGSQTHAKRKLQKSEKMINKQRNSKEANFSVANPTNDPSPITPPKMPSSNERNVSVSHEEGSDFWTSEVDITPPTIHSMIQKGAKNITSSPTTVEVTPTPISEIKTSLCGSGQRNAPVSTLDPQTFHSIDSWPCSDNLKASKSNPKRAFPSKISNAFNSVCELASVNNNYGQHPQIEQLYHPNDIGQQNKTNSCGSHHIRDNSSASIYGNADSRNRDLPHDCTMSPYATQSKTYVPVPNSCPRKNVQNSSWKISQRKHQREQKRAFTEKNSNPFNGFAHDPNDFENHLHKLQDDSRGIIPAGVRAKLKQKKSGRHSHFKNRRQKPMNQRRSQTFDDVLREKAIEHQCYQETRKMQPQTHGNPSPRFQHRYSNEYDYHDPRLALKSDFGYFDPEYQAVSLPASQITQPPQLQYSQFQYPQFFQNVQHPQLSRKDEEYRYYDLQSVPAVPHWEGQQESP